MGGGLGGGRGWVWLGSRGAFSSDCVQTEVKCVGGSSTPGGVTILTLFSGFGCCRVLCVVDKPDGTG